MKLTTWLFLLCAAIPFACQSREEKARVCDERCAPVQSACSASCNGVGASEQGACQTYCLAQNQSCASACLNAEQSAWEFAYTPTFYKPSTTPVVCTNGPTRDIVSCKAACDEAAPAVATCTNNCAPLSGAAKTQCEQACDAASASLKQCRDLCGTDGSGATGTTGVVGGCVNNPILEETDPVLPTDDEGTPTDPPTDRESPPPPSPQTIPVASATILPANNGKTIVLNAISGASKSIHLGLYLLTDSAITTALTDAQARGVDVQVVIDDSMQTSSLNKKNVASLEDAGVAVVKDNNHTFHHAKYMILDAKEAMIMTCNFSAPSFSSNREVITKVQDAPTVAALEAVFQADIGHQPTTYGLSNPLVISPDNTREKLTGLIANATEQIFVGMQSVDDNDFVYHLIGMKKQGVRVRVLIADPADKGGDAGDAAWLKGQGVEVRYLPSPYLHEKVILADDKAFVGSVNLTVTSITKNREIGVVGDAAFTAIMLKQLENDWDTAVVF